MYDLEQFTIRRKFFKIFGASFHVYDAAGRPVGFSKQKAFKLKEDIRVYSDESMRTELLTIKARQVIDFSAAYDVVDAPQGVKVGAARRKGFKSFLRDSWEILDTNDSPVARLVEDSMTKALLRRFLSDWIPQRFRLLDGRDGVLAEMRVHFNPFLYRLTVTVRPDCPLDRRLVVAAAVLISAIEGRQSS